MPTSDGNGITLELSLGFVRSPLCSKPTQAVVPIAAASTPIKAPDLIIIFIIFHLHYKGVSARTHPCATDHHVSNFSKKIELRAKGMQKTGQKIAQPFFSAAEREI